MPGERLLIGQQQCLMAGVEIGALQLRDRIRINAARRHEIQRFANAIGNVLEAFRPRRTAHKVMRPSIDLMKVGIATLRKSAQQVQRCGRLRIGPQHTLGVRRAPFGFKRNVIDNVTAIARQ